MYTDKMEIKKTRIFINAYRAFFKVINIKYKPFFEYLFMFIFG